MSARVLFAHMKLLAVAHSVHTAWCLWVSTYHGLLGESTDLLDGAGSPLLEGNAVDLYTVSALCSPSVFRPIPAQREQTLEPA